MLKPITVFILALGLVLELPLAPPLGAISLFLELRQLRRLYFPAPAQFRPEGLAAAAQIC